MALARLSAIFILILYIKDSYGQQPGLGNKPGMGSTFGPMGCQQQAIQRKQGLISNPSIFSQLSTPSDMGCSCNLKQQNGNLNVQQQGLQQSLNLQQTSNCQPSVQQQQSLQQSNNLQQFPNFQPSIQQQQNLQQSQFQSLPYNLQQQLLQPQQQQKIPVTNLQIVGQQQPSFQTSDISFASLPIVNGQISSLPSQISQGVLLSNLGLQSSLPSILPNSCNYKQQTEKNPLFVSQNSLSPVSIMEGSQFSLSIPVTSSQPVEFTNSNNPPLSFMIPVTFQNNQAAQQNEQTFDMPQNSATVIQSQPQQNRVAFNPVQLQSQPVTSMQRQLVTNPVGGKPSISSLLLSQMQSPNKTPQCSGATAISSDSILNLQSNNKKLQFPSLTIPVTSSQPVEFTNSNNQPLSFMIPATFQNNQAGQQNEQTHDIPQNFVTVIQSQPQQNRVAFNPVQLQSQPVTSMQSQAVTNPILGLSQMQSPNITPQYSGPTVISPDSVSNSQSNNQDSKASSIKALLPLIFNILQEKNSGCGCPQSCGPDVNNSPPPCGPITPNNFNNNRNINCVEPYVSSGYSNLINYDRRNEDTSTNNIGSEESSKSRQRKGYKKYKHQYDDSLESTEADDEYDDVDYED